jgi:hypothetical protein
VIDVLLAKRVVQPVYNNGIKEASKKQLFCLSYLSFLEGPFLANAVRVSKNGVLGWYNGSS